MKMDLFTRVFFLCCGWGLCCFATMNHHRAAYMAPPPPANRIGVSAQIPDNTIANVYDYGAMGDGVTDDTKAFQSALDDMGGVPGGIVYAPTGQFRIEGSLNVPRGVSLIGTYLTVPSHTMGENGYDVPDDGTILLPYGGRGTEDGYFIQLNDQTTFKGVVIYYPEQDQTGPPVPYPWSIAMIGCNSAVEDVECLNCWNAISAVGAHRHYIARVQGQPINIGIYVDQTYDIGRIEDVHWNPWFSQEQSFVNWQLLYGRAFVFARSDWEYVFNTFAFAYAIGYHFIESEYGATNGNFLGIGADMMANCSLKVDQAQFNGLLITNPEFTSFVDPKWGVEQADCTQVVTTDSNIGPVHIVNGAFWGPSNQIAEIRGKGNVVFSECVFAVWDGNHLGRFALNAYGPGSLQVLGNDFLQEGKQVYIGPGVSKAIISGNLFEGNTTIQNDGCPRVQIGLNQDDS